MADPPEVRGKIVIPVRCQPHVFVFGCSKDTCILSHGFELMGLSSMDLNNPPDDCRGSSGNTKALCLKGSSMISNLVSAATFQTKSLVGT